MVMSQGRSQTDKQSENSVVQVAFLGLGTMGYPMAGHLAQNPAVHTTVYNRTASVSRRWKNAYAEYPVTVASSIAQAVKNADVVMSCLGNDQDVEEVYTGSVFKVARPGAVFVDHTTTSARLAETLADKAKACGSKFLDAPVSGGQAGAEQGALAVMVGGDKEALHQIKPILASYAKAITYVGKSGGGQRCKMVNQLCVAGVLQGLSEGLSLAKRVGISADVVLQALQEGAGSSWQMIHRTTSMMEDQFDFGFAVGWMRKDLGLCLDEAQEYGLDLPLARMVDGIYQQLQELGFQRSDTSVLIKQFDLPRLNDSRDAT